MVNINIGVAGGVDSTLNVGDIIIGEKLVQHDFDITAFNHEKGYIPNVGKYLDADEYLLDEREIYYIELLESYKYGYNKAELIYLINFHNKGYNYYNYLIDKNKFVQIDNTLSVDESVKAM